MARKLSTSGRDIASSLDKCTLSTRGWTFQEYIFSRRSVIFLDKIVWFHSPGLVFEEDQIESTADNWEDHPLQDFDIRYNPKHLARVNVDRYFAALELYSKRDLTNQQDAIDAFSAMLTILRPTFRCDYLFGLPETELESTLLWLPDGPMLRRIDTETGEPVFPTWSWAGWKGKIRGQALRGGFSRVTWINPFTGSSFTTQDRRGIDDPVKSGWKLKPSQLSEETYNRPDAAEWYEVSDPATCSIILLQQTRRTAFAFYEKARIV
jgi:hypothetical protein